MKEWTYEEAVELIFDCLIDNTDEDTLSETDARVLANKIAKKLEAAQ